MEEMNERECIAMEYLSDKMEGTAKMIGKAMLR